jgi:hypothetical protein
MKKFLALMVAIVFVVPVTADVTPIKKTEIKLPTKEDVPQYLQDISVTIRAGTAEGSGVVTNIDGECYVLTCAHVCRHLRNTKVVEDATTGRPKTVVDWDDAEIVKEYVEEGRLVGQSRMQAFVIKYSDANHGEDLAILKIRKKNFSPIRVAFCLDSKIPKLGTELWHVGSFLGQDGSNSLSSGMIAQVGRVYESNVYDQTTCTAFRGSSGGGVFLKDGQYHSMLVRGAGETFNLVVPMRRIQNWVKRTKTEWLINPEITAPKVDDEWIRKNIIEESHHDRPDSSKAAAVKEKFEFLIKEFEKPTKLKTNLLIEEK